MQINSSIFIQDPPRNCRGIFYLFLIVSGLFCSAVLQAQAKLEVQENKKSFGKVLKGQKVSLLYLVKNNGNQPLIFEKAEVSCDCTSAAYPKAPLLPGDTVTVKVTFETRSAIGRQDRVVFLHSNDPASPAKLRFKGIVVKY